MEHAPGCDDTTDKIYTLMQLKLVGRQKLIDGLLFLKEVQWTTAGVGQGHAMANTMT